MAERSMQPVHVEDWILEEFKKLPVATIWGTVQSTLGVPFPFMEGVNLIFSPGQKRLAARARTLRFHPMRPDLIAEVRDNENSPEYRAMARCGPGDVLVADQQGVRYAGIAGDVKLLQLKMNNAEGVVTDGAIRDMSVLRDENYDLIVYAQGRTPYGQQPWGEPAEENIDIQCGGALVRPGDVIVGDEDGVVVVPSWFAEECLAITKEHEDAETWVKEKTISENGIPGQFYGNNLMDNYRNRDK
jgi:5-oxopent-3-ene-1,2,5-tricarboxylate decarboxylase/2-hydroxyhepta-2,4-diene-1,7-dioate isomerase